MNSRFTLSPQFSYTSVQSAASRKLQALRAVARPGGARLNHRPQSVPHSWTKVILINSSTLDFSPLFSPESFISSLYFTNIARRTSPARNAVVLSRFTPKTSVVLLHLGIPYLPLATVIYRATRHNSVLVSVGVSVQGVEVVKRTESQGKPCQTAD